MKLYSLQMASASKSFHYFNNFSDLNETFPAQQIFSMHLCDYFTGDAVVFDNTFAGKMETKLFNCTLHLKHNQLAQQQQTNASTK